MVHTYDEAVQYLKSFIPFTLYQTDAYQKRELKYPLGRMCRFLIFLRTPEQEFRSILVGGTSGKGSTAYLISHMLTDAGYKTGLTLSPHLIRINERIQLNGKEISNNDFVSLLNQVIPAIEQMKKTEYGVPSYFEIVIGMAFLYFAQKKVDIAVVEVGMGGEHDATNTLPAIISVLTNVSLDHTQFLGDTVEEIAMTKVGIIKNYESGIMNYGKIPIVITGVKQPSVIKIVEEKCQKVGSKLFRLGKDFVLTKKHIGLAGEYQKENASLAIETIKQLKQFGFSIDDQTIRQALKTAHFPGRFEIINYTLDTIRYTLVLDGAHNSAKMHAFVTSLEKIYPKKKKIFVIGFKKDKNITDMLKEILPVADAIVVTEFAIGTDTMISNAAMDVSSIKYKVLSSGYKGALYEKKDSKKALEKAISLCHPEPIRQAQAKLREGSHQILHLVGNDNNCVIVVTGSLYLVGEIKQRLIFLA